MKTFNSCLIALVSVYSATALAGGGNDQGLGRCSSSIESCKVTGIISVNTALLNRLSKKNLTEVKNGLTVGNGFEFRPCTDGLEAIISAPGFGSHYQIGGYSANFTDLNFGESVADAESFPLVEGLLISPTGVVNALVATSPEGVPQTENLGVLQMSCFGNIDFPPTPNEGG